MPSDSESKLPAPPRRELRALPNIQSIKIERVQYKNARKHTVAGKLVELREGVEIIVQTDGEIPVRALSPALHVGSAEIAENERIGDKAYRFFVLDAEALKKGDPITLGWVGARPSKTRTKFRYEPPRGSTMR
jgi:hypothetical protein